MLSELKKSKYLCIILVVFIISSIADILWIQKNNVPQAWDESQHLISSLEYYYTLQNSPTFEALNSIDTYYPPFYHLSTVMMYYLFGTSDKAAISINIIYFGILLYATYGIGKKLYSEETGIIAALFISLFPAVVGMKRYYLLEVPLLSTVALSVYFLLMSDNFRNKKYSLLFGISFAVAILTKWTALFFIIGPLSVVIYQLIKSDKIKCIYCGKGIKDGEFCSSEHKHLYKKNKKNIIPDVKCNIVLMGLIAFIIASVWYLPHIEQVTKTIIWGNEYWGTTEGDPDVISFNSFTYYLWSTLRQTSFLLFLPFIGGLYYIFKKNDIMLISSIALPYIVMTLMHNKNDRYLIGILFAVAIIGALWIVSIKNINLKKLAVLGIILVGGLQLYTMLMGYNIDISAGKYDLYPKQYYGTSPPQNEDWKVVGAINNISDDMRNNPRINNRITVVGVLSDMPYVNGLTYQYYSYSMKKAIQVIPIPYFEAVEPFEKNLLNFDYVILKTGENSGNSRLKLVGDMYNLFYEQGKDFYVEFYKVNLPDNSELIIYKNNFVLQR